MSNQIRDTISQKKQLLQRQLSSSPAVAENPTPNANQAPEEIIAEFTAIESLLSVHSTRINETVRSIEDAQAEWSKIMHKMSERERTAEGGTYQQFMAGPDNPYDTLDLAAGVIEGMGTKLVKVRRVLALAKIDRDKAHAEAKEEARSLEQGRALELLNAQAEVVNAQARLAALPIPTLPTGITPPAGQGLAHLPKIQLRKFAGSRAEWMPFKRLFKSTFANEKSGVILLTRLLSLLEGEPQRLIMNLDLLDENYEKAMQLLDNEYGDEKMRVRELLVQLRNIKDCKQPHEVREFRLQVETTCMQLESLKHPIDPMAWVELQTKLPINVIKKMQEMEEMDTNEWDLNCFREALGKIVRQEERARIVKDLSKKVEEKPTTSPRGKQPKKEDKATVYSAQSSHNTATKETGEQKKREPFCYFCEGDRKKTHWSDQCKKFTDLKGKRKRARELDLCTKCLRKGHIWKECRVKVKCFHCKGEHSSAMCDQPQTRTDQHKADNNKKKAKGKKPEEDSDNDPTEEHLVASNLGAPRTTVSMCIRAEVFNPNDKNARATALVVFDSLSHCSFIKEELRKKLKLSKEESVNLPLISFQATWTQASQV
jgi:hypothetical protein